MKVIYPVIFLCFFSACSLIKSDDEPESEDLGAARLAQMEEAAPRVAVLPVKRGVFELELISNGRLEAQRKSKVPFSVQEQVKEVLVREGERVRAGQVLGRVDAFSYQNRLDEALNRHQQALIDLEDRLLGFGYQIRDTSRIPQEHLQMAKIRSGLSMAEIALKEAQRNMELTTIKAPVAGVVTNLEAQAYNPSNSFQKFCDVLDLSNMRLVFYLLETELQGVEPGQLVEVRPFALQGERFDGRVLSVNPMVDEKGMVRITAIVPNKGERLMDGMNARVLLKKEIPDCISIPKSAVLYRQNRQVVFIYKEGKAIWTYVETGNENSSEVVVTDGLEEGMEVIYENNLNLAHETVVVIE